MGHEALPRLVTDISSADICKREGLIHRMVVFIFTTQQGLVPEGVQNDLKIKTKIQV